MLSVFRRMLYAAGPHAPQLRRSLLLSVLASAVQGAALALFFPLFAALLAAPVDGPYAWTLVALLAGLTGLEAVLRWFEKDFDWDTQPGVTHELRLRLGEQLRQIPLEALNRRRSGDLSVVLGGNVDEIVTPMGMLASTVIKTVVVPAVAILATFFYDPRLALAMLALFPCAAPLFRRIRLLASRAFCEGAEAHADTAARLVEYTQGLPVLRATKQVGARAVRLREALATLRAVQTRGQRLTTLPNLLLSSLVEVGILVVLALGVFFVLGGSLGLPVLFALTVIAARFSEPLALLADLASTFDYMEAGLERVEAVLGVSPLPVSQPPKRLSSFDLSFENVTFGYAEQPAPVLKGVSFHLPERSFTALVGPSGGGKTTVTRLLTRYADVQAGAVKIGGVDVRDVRPSELLRHLSVVFQDVYLFDDTVLGNIRMAKPDATDAEVKRAARAANCHDFVRRLPEGYHTRVGDLGGALSGGERQRISIARAILKDAPIVILDEPTAALDTESEVAVQRAIERLVENKTVVVIAHRLSTVAAADQVLVLEEGRIVERGTHAELLEQRGRYAAMWRAQAAARGWRVAA